MRHKKERGLQGKPKNENYKLDNLNPPPEFVEKIKKTIEEGKKKIVHISQLKPIHLFAKEKNNTTKKVK